MITMDKQSLKTHVFLYIERLDEDSEQYERFCDIILTAMGVVNPDGTLSDDYAESDLWDGGDDGTPLRPSYKAKIKSIIPQEQWNLLEPHEPKA
ncbi:hypothetical protein [Raoultibacter timonensis]|uniref:Uncharacterized protein n=1 Tax=Raoultibacter timonensis TaxID=1907662 RepID=A0ABN6MA97_9ACTN|nr:hypothetical protein [Raoultibacter timonensis]BDE94938.1 hypothetical protein CE91St30_02710 [Raoultibacter timonensis]BDF49541.1 hypothetical protein CE91St31_02710 [Raoultibacter timonensis]